jgi:hypothetical protein
MTISSLQTWCGGVAVAVALMVAAPAAFAQSGSVAGVWTLTVNSPEGAASARLAVADESGRLSGLISGERGSYPVQGTRAEDKVTLNFTIRYDGAPLPITLTAKPAADTLEGAVDFGGQETGTWKATRTDAGAADGAWTFTASDSSGSSSTGVLTLLDANGTVNGRLVIRSRGVDGAVKGIRTADALKLTVEATVDGSPITIDLPGSVDGKALKGTFSVADLSGTWTASPQ